MHGIWWRPSRVTRMPTAQTASLRLCLCVCECAGTCKLVALSAVFVWSRPLHPVHHQRNCQSPQLSDWLKSSDSSHMLSMRSCALHLNEQDLENYSYYLSALVVSTCSICRSCAQWWDSHRLSFSLGRVYTFDCMLSSHLHRFEACM